MKNQLYTNVAKTILVKEFKWACIKIKIKVFDFKTKNTNVFVLSVYLYQHICICRICTTF